MSELSKAVAKAVIEEISIAEGFWEAVEDGVAAIIGDQETTGILYPDPSGRHIVRVKILECEGRVPCVITLSDPIDYLLPHLSRAIQSDLELVRNEIKGMKRLKSDLEQAIYKAEKKLKIVEANQ